MTEPPETTTAEENKSDANAPVVTQQAASDDSSAPAEEEEEKKESKEEEVVPPPKKKETEEEAKKRREKYKDWPMKNIEEPHENDVLYGRGGGTNHHKGNKRYRKMVEDRKVDYVNSKRLDKPLVALDIIREWRNQEPPGRFLKMDEKNKRWNDVGDKKAREKTSQALREKAPLIRQKQAEERRRLGGGTAAADEDDDNDSDDNAATRTKSTRFAEGTHAHDGAREETNKAVLARDHSLGREYLEPDQAMTLDGFSWQDPFRNGASTNSPGRVSSQGSYNTGPPPPGGFTPDARMGSAGSNMSTGPPPYFYPGSGPPPPHPAAYSGSRTSSSGEERHYRYTASGRYESWGNGMPPPMPGAYGYPSAPGGSWGPPGEREHSLGQNPLPHASVGRPAQYSTFDGGRAASGQWGGPPPNGYPPMSGPPSYNYSGGVPPPSGAYPPGREYSGGPPVMPSPTDRRLPSSPNSSNSNSSTSPRYEVDPAVASNWSGQKPTEQLAKSWSGSSDDPERFRNQSKPAATTSSNNDNNKKNVPKPEFVKRQTSHQNETVETKPGLQGPSVKRAALNRDNSMASNRLKEKYLPDYYTMKKFDHDREMRQLSDNLEQSTLSSPAAAVKPKPLDERVSTIDQIAMELMVKPEPLTSTSRSSTIEALALDDLDEDPWAVRPELMARISGPMDGMFVEKGEPGVAKPSALTGGDRMTTADLLSIVNEPLAADELELVSGKRQVL